MSAGFTPRRVPPADACCVLLVPLLKYGSIEQPSSPLKGAHPDDYRMRPCPVDVAVADGAAIQVGRLTLQAIATPGHSRGHCAYLLVGNSRRHLLAGDVVFWGGRVLLQNTWDCSIQELAASMTRLAGLAVDALLPGHGLLPLTDGQAEINRALATFRKLLVPPSLL